MLCKLAIAAFRKKIQWGGGGQKGANPRVSPVFRQKHRYDIIFYIKYRQGEVWARRGSLSALHPLTLSYS